MKLTPAQYKILLLVASGHLYREDGAYLVNGNRPIPAADVKVLEDRGLVIDTTIVKGAQSCRVVLTEKGRKLL